MIPLVLDFARDVVENLPVDAPVLEVGSRPAEGQEQLAVLRGLFAADTDYTGCDIQEGPFVDRVEDVHALSFEDASFGTVLCLETLEHVADPIRAVQEMHRVLAPGGLLAISSQMFFPIHAHPWDYWRFTPEGFANLLKDFESRLVVPFGFALLPQHVFGVGVKGPCGSLTQDRLPRLDRHVRAWGAEHPVDLGPIRMTTRDLVRLAARESAVAAGRKARLYGGRALRRVGAR